MRRSSHSRRILGIAAFIALAGAPQPSLAGAAPTIAWDVPAGCPDVGVLQAEVVRLIGADAPMKVADIRARVERRDDGWHLVVLLTVEGRALERTLTTDSCEAATRAAAFIVAIAIDPAAGGLDPAPAPEPGPVEPDLVPTAGPTSVPVDTPAEPAPTERPPGTLDDRPTRPRLTPRGLLQLGPGLQVGMMPVGVGLAAAFGLLWPRLRVALGYARWFPTRVPVPTRPGLLSELSAHAATLRAGPVLRAGPLEVPLYLGVELGALRTAGIGADVNFTRRGLWGAAIAGAGVGWAPRALRGHGALILAAELAIALHRPRLVFNEDIEAYRIGLAAFRGYFLVEARFP